MKMEWIIHKESYERYKDVAKNYIIVGNKEAGGWNAGKIVKMLEEDLGEIFLLQSHKHGENSLSRDLIELEEDRKDVDIFIDLIS